ncbi:hypothetical protein [Ferrimicrobium acidiphilum]|uniref:hypothetical protein n=1 Tax=Ferrimicrobium acidiphilum TaxID=121039 RepID=UPI0023F24255|nr:hypothetical protein [Ferrimicrobium acidiphilum]
MTQQVIGRPLRVSAREVWRGGSQELIDWFVDHPSALNDMLDLPFVSVQRGRVNSSYAVDLLAEDAEGRPAVIEVSLSRSGNAGLGRLITYASVLQAGTAVWIVEDITAEHVSAVGWLNRSGIANFYLIQVQCLKGSDGTATHLLTRILGPSNLIRSAESERRSLMDHSDLRLAFFEHLGSQSYAPVMVPATKGSASVVHRLTRLPGVTYNFLVEPYECGAEIRIIGTRERRNEANRIFQALLARRGELEAGLVPDVLLWESLNPGNFRIAVMMPGGYASPDGEWDEIQLQLVELMRRMRMNFKKHLHSLADH